MFREFREFAVKGNVVDMAVGIIIGAAFTSIVNSLVADIIMPPIGLILGKVDFSNLFIVLKEGKTPAPYSSLTDARAAAAVTLNYGFFINAVISFVIVAFTTFFLVRSINRLKSAEKTPVVATNTKECPYCFSIIPLKASRCGHCTSELKGE